MLEHLGFAGALDCPFMEKKTNEYPYELNQSPLSPYLFSTAFQRLKKGENDVSVGIFMVAF